MSDSIKIIIPFRLREGADMRRAANLEVVQAWWYAHGFDPAIVDDGLKGDASFNRHRAYNRAVARFPETDVFVFTEADMLIHPDQIHVAANMALGAPGLVVPFTQYRYLSDELTASLRDTYHDQNPEYIAHWWGRPSYNDRSIFRAPAESIMDNGKSIGAVNVVSRGTLDITGGFTEATSGNWYDDNIIEEGFAFLTGTKTRFVDGPAVHMYHLPGWKGDHLSAKDRQATAHNKRLLTRMRMDVGRGDRAAVKRLMTYRAVPQDAGL